MIAAPYIHNQLAKNGNQSLNRLLDSNNRMASIGMSSGSNIIVAPESNIRNMHTISAKGAIFGLGGRPRNLNEQSGAGVGHGYGSGAIEQATLPMDERASRAYVGS